MTSKKIGAPRKKLKEDNSQSVLNLLKEVEIALTYKQEGSGTLLKFFKEQLGQTFTSKGKHLQGTTKKTSTANRYSKLPRAVLKKKTEASPKLYHGTPCVYGEHKCKSHSAVKPPKQSVVKSNQHRKCHAPKATPKPFPSADLFTDIVKPVKDKMNEFTSNHSVKTPLQTCKLIGVRDWTCERSTIEHYHPVVYHTQDDKFCDSFSSKLRLPVEEANDLKRSHTVGNASPQGSKVQRMAKFWNEKLAKDPKKPPVTQQKNVKKNSKTQTKTNKTISGKNPKNANVVIHNRSIAPAIRKGQASEKNLANKSSDAQDKISESQETLSENCDLKKTQSMFSGGSQEENEVIISREPSTVVESISPTEERDGFIQNFDFICSNGSPLGEKINESNCDYLFEASEPLKNEVNMHDIISTLDKLQIMLEMFPNYLDKKLVSRAGPEHSPRGVDELSSSSKKIISENEHFNCLQFPWEKRIFISPLTGRIIGYRRIEFSLSFICFICEPYYAYEYEMINVSAMAICVHREDLETCFIATMPSSYNYFGNKMKNRHCQTDKIKFQRIRNQCFRVMVNEGRESKELIPLKRKVVSMNYKFDLSRRFHVPLLKNKGSMNRVSQFRKSKCVNKDQKISNNVFVGIKRLINISDINLDFIMWYLSEMYPGTLKKCKCFQKGVQWTVTQLLLVFLSPSRRPCQYHIEQIVEKNVFLSLNKVLKHGWGKCGTVLKTIVSFKCPICKTVLCKRLPADELILKSSEIGNQWKMYMLIIVSALFVLNIYHVVVTNTFL